MKRLTLLLFGVLVLAWFTVAIKAPSYSDLHIYASSIGFQNTPDRYVTLTTTSGMLNCSNASLTIGDDRGVFTFMANETVTFTVAFANGTRCLINSVQTINGGSSGSLSQNSVNRVEWQVLVEPWLPFLFILGVIGIGCMFGGPLYTVHLIKKGDYREAFTQGTIFLALGFGLVLAWLWGGV